jgi:biotin carboxyl carrier protein
MSQPPRPYRVEIDGTTLGVVVETREGVLTAAVADDAWHERPLRVLSSGSDPLVLVAGRVVALSFGSGDVASYRGLQLTARVRPATHDSAEAPSSLASDGNVRAPMPGRVVAVQTRLGEEVAAGAPLVVVEAMKMQNELLAPRAGTVLRIAVAAGDTVERGAILVELS